MTNRYLERLEKQGSLLAGAALSHLAQNLAMKKALGNKTVGGYIARGFNDGVKGVVDTSLKGKATRVAAGAIAPDVGLMHKELHALGEAARPHLQKLSLKEKAALRHAVRFGKAPTRYQHVMDKPDVKALQHMMQQKVKGLAGVDAKAIVQGQASHLWKDPNLPLLSNVAKQIGVNRPVKGKFVQKELSSHGSLTGSALAGVADPGVGLVDGVKALAGSHAVKQNKYGHAATKYLQEKFIKNPALKGFKNPGNKFNSFKDKAFEYVVSPTSVAISRTTSAIADATGKTRIK